MGLWGLNTSLAGWLPGSGDTESVPDTSDTETPGPEPEPEDFLRFLESFWALQQQERNMVSRSGSRETVRGTRRS